MTNSRIESTFWQITIDGARDALYLFFEPLHGGISKVLTLVFNAGASKQFMAAFPAAARKPRGRS